MRIREIDILMFTFIRVIEMAIVIKRELIIKRKLFIVPTADFVNCVKVAIRMLELISPVFGKANLLLCKKPFYLFDFL